MEFEVFGFAVKACMGSVEAPPGRGGGKAVEHTVSGSGILVQWFENGRWDRFEKQDT
jgi:hypothetical protein